MSAVQRTICSIDGQVDIRITANTEDDLLSARLVNRSITDDKSIGLEQLSVLCEYLSEMW
jgi:hypothetical protein